MFDNSLVMNAEFLSKNHAAYTLFFLKFDRVFVDLPSDHLARVNCLLKSTTFITLTMSNPFRCYLSRSSIAFISFKKYFAQSKTHFHIFPNIIFIYLLITIQLEIIFQDYIPKSLVRTEPTTLTLIV